MNAKELVVVVVSVFITGTVSTFLQLRSNEPPKIVKYAILGAADIHDYADSEDCYVSLQFVEKDTGEIFGAKRDIMTEKANELREQAASLIELVTDNEEEYLFRLTLEPAGYDYRLISIELFR